MALFTLAACGLFLASTRLFLVREPANPWPARLSLPVLAVVLAYSLTKRFTSLAHFWLGAALMLAPVASWVAIRGVTDWGDMAPPLVLGLAVLFWVSGFDMLYACQDADFDRAAGLHSVPARLGVRGALRAAAACHAATFGALVAFGLVTPELGTLYFAGLAPVAALLAYQHAILSPHDLRRVNEAFFRVNGVISFGLLALVGVQLLVR